jgi:hypothetical protein
MHGNRLYLFKTCLKKESRSLLASQRSTLLRYMIDLCLTYNLELFVYVVLVVPITEQAFVVRDATT